MTEEDVKMVQIINVDKTIETKFGFYYLNYRPLQFKKEDKVKVIKGSIKDQLSFFMECVEDEYSGFFPDHIIELKRKEKPCYVVPDPSEYKYVTHFEPITEMKDMILCPECYCVLDPSMLINQKHHDDEDYYLCPNTCSASFSEHGNFDVTYDLLLNAFKKIRKEEIQKKHILLDNFMVK